MSDWWSQQTEKHSLFQLSFGSSPNEALAIKQGWKFASFAAWICQTDLQEPVGEAMLHVGGAGEAVIESQEGLPLERPD